ncbi:hypothetical protein DPMN_145913 [Dreissena polymorpha]|uniref:Uncharacterized protein n=1 Tax=Dreissena polymorpha TaxID=45954 RepID=A0A9D4F633_DREPO|nr:hypothetical protein DPMN_145913 [Dreissena polymorpha]
MTSSNSLWTLSAIVWIKVSQYDADGDPLRDPGSTGMNRGSTGMNGGSIGYDRDEPGKTVAPPGKYLNDRQRTARQREQRDGTTPAELLQRLGECRYSPGIATVYKKTGALPERYRHSPGLRRGITGDDRALPGSDAGIDAVIRFTGALPAFIGAQPGHYRGSAGASPG